MSGGGKGGSQTTRVEVPQWLEQAAQQNIGRADQVSQIGYTPYYGPDVAAFTPMQQAAFQNTGNAASAFGLAAPSDPMGGMPAPQTFAGGVQGYGSGGLYDQSLAALQAARPGQFAAMQAPFIDPVTGAQPTGAFARQTMPVAVAGNRSRSGGGGGGGSMMMASPAVQTGAGFTSFRDMFDGGGAGAEGDTFQGGPMSGSLNRIGVQPVRSSGSSGMGGGK
jgi:hypothetical protein